ncbi:hypothetical protein ILUMI_03714 [Ignelater luminosus]|uniref:PiggyBac transposable element-derived protein domain-containing protein n=1 Tax=Ignelater luminosus TaxID=2038154 RepID=A0A8K0GJP0_IGNLU|nr:hypothetical protein ILUMI_03714 [Ignelater luminosus]
MSLNIVVGEIDDKRLLEKVASPLGEEEKKGKKLKTGKAPSKDDVEFDEEVTIDEAFKNETIEDQPQSNATEEDFDSKNEQPLSNFLKENIVWGKQVANSSHSILDFNSAFGPDIPDDIEYPRDVFLYSFTTELLERIVFETNLYASQQYGNRFIPTFLDKIKAFIGLNIIMGNNVLQPKKTEEGYDKLYKILLLLDILLESYKKCFKPSENQSVAKAMVKFKGSIGFRQHIPLKPTKRGYKIWARADKTDLGPGGKEEKKSEPE